MEAYDIRSEVASKGQKYYIQTTAVPAQRTIVTSLFQEGTLLSKETDSYDASASDDTVRGLVRRNHEEKKSRILALLEIREKLKRMEDGKAHLKLSEALYHQNLYREAMSEAVYAVKLGMETSQAFSILGNSLLALGEHAKALKSFRKGIELSPEYPDLHNDLGRVYMKVKQCGDAARAFEKATELNKYYQEAFLNLAVALCLNVVEKEDFDLSKDLRRRLQGILAKVVQLKPALDTEEFRGALRAVDAERFEEAYDILSRIQARSDAAIDPTTHLSLDLYLILKFNSEHLSEDEIDRFIHRIGRALEANPGYADLQNDLGVLYTAKCKLYIDKAKEAFQTSLRINRRFRKAEKNLKLTENDGQGIHLLLRALLD